MSTHSWAHACQAGGPGVSPSMGSGVLLGTRMWTLGRGRPARHPHLPANVSRSQRKHVKKPLFGLWRSLCLPWGSPKAESPQCLYTHDDSTSLRKDSALTRHPEARTGTPALRPTPAPLRSSVRQGSAPHACWEIPALLSGAETGVQGGSCTPLSLHVRPRRPREPGTGCSWHRPHTGLGDRGQVGGSLCWVSSPWPWGSSASPVSLLLSALGGQPGSAGQRISRMAPRTTGCSVLSASRTDVRVRATRALGLFDVDSE